MIKVSGLPGPIADLPREPWVGRDYAYQIPAYYYSLRAIASKGSLDIEPTDVMAETKRS